MKTAVYVFVCVTMLVAGQLLVKQGLTLKGGFQLSFSCADLSGKSGFILL